MKFRFYSSLGCLFVDFFFGDFAVIPLRRKYIFSTNQGIEASSG
jgi:hypothetical protein